MRDTIKRHKDFAVGEDDGTARCAYFLIRARTTLFPGDARYGLIVTKRTFRHAVDRNRAKRLLREWLHRYQDYLRPDLDYIFIARPSIFEATRLEGYLAMRKALHYLRRQEVDAASFVEGTNLICARGRALGFAKRIGARVNNGYPASLRIFING